MKDLLTSFLEALKATNQQTRIVIGAGVLMLLAVIAFSTYRAKNPHMEFFRGELTSQEFSSVTSALGQAGIRFETSSGGAPYAVWVESGMKYDAFTAIATSGALDPGTRGIETSGSSSAFDASMERTQRANARYWQEIEKQLEVLSWVQRASVRAAMPTRTVLGRRPEATVSVVLTTRGSLRPSRQQARDVYSIVQHAFSVPVENVTITDHHGVALLDTDTDDGLEGILAFESGFERTETERAQTWLDQTYGPGIARVSVAGEWTYERTEEVGESLDGKGMPVSEETIATSTPTPSPVGGPAGLAANLNPAPQPQPQADPATMDETSKTYVYGTKTTHTVRTEPRLQRLSVSLLMDSSRASELEAATEIVKGLVGFVEERDSFSGQSTELFGLERDEEGNPIAPTAIESPAPPSPMMQILLERALEVGAAAVFLFLLLRTLKKSRSPAEQRALDKQEEAEITRRRIQEENDTLTPQEIDPGVLQRRTVENLIDEDPERVSALLSRWALGEDFYTSTK